MDLDCVIETLGKDLLDGWKGFIQGDRNPNFVNGSIPVTIRVVGILKEVDRFLVSRIPTGSLHSFDRFTLLVLPSPHNGLLYICLVRIL